MSLFKIPKDALPVRWLVYALMQAQPNYKDKLISSEQRPRLIDRAIGRVGRPRRSHFDEAE